MPLRSSAKPIALRLPALRRSLSLRIQLLVAMVGLVVLTAVSVGFIVYSALEAAIVPRGLARIEAHVTRLASTIEHRTEGSLEDIGAIAASASVSGLVAAMAAPDGRHLDLGVDGWRNLVVQSFVAQVGAKTDYLQVRLIARDGREVVRVDAGPRPVPQAELQDKSARDYVAATLALDKGEVYVSPLDLNREHGAVEVPGRPVLRVATPIDAPDGSRWGLAILNLDVAPLLRELREAVVMDGTLYIVNTDGDYVLHPDPAQEFAFEFGTPRRITADMPDLIGALGGLAAIDGTPKALIWDDRVVAVATAELLQSNPLLIVETAPDRSLVAAAAVRRSALAGGALVALVAVVLAVFLARMTARPIVAMTDAVSNGGDPAVLPVHSAGEVGTLARSLARFIESERWHGSVLANAHEAFLATGPDGRLMSLNPSAQALFGLSAADALGRSASTLVPSEQAGALRDLLSRVATGEVETGTFEATLTAGDGGVSDILMRISPVRAASGALMGASILARDVTDERAARESFRIATEHSPAGKLLIDPQGQIILVNAATERCFGYRREELLGLHFQELVPLGAQAAHKGLVAQYMAHPTPRAMGADREVLGRRKDGSEIPLEILLSTVPSRQGLLVLAAIVDISERREARAKLDRRTRELERSNADLLQFAYVASHDMQEPLRITASFAQLLSDRYKGKLDDKADKYIHYIVDGARRMQALINDILIYSRLGADDTLAERAELGEALAEAMTQLDGAFQEAGATLVVDDPLPVVRGEMSALVRLFSNLLGNAVKYRGSAPLEVHVSARQEDGLWHIAVRDNGIGFDEKYKHKIFEMFQRITVAGSARGSGLGLAIAKRIVNQHGGDIWASSKPGEGATFEFTLPGTEP